VQQRAERVVAEHAVETAGDEGPDGDEQAVIGGVVHEPAGDGRGEHGCDPREQNDREHRLGPVGERVLRVVAQRDEHGTRPLQDERGTQPPVTHQLLSVTTWPL
jgi:hypothetical protein